MSGINFTVNYESFERSIVRSIIMKRGGEKKKRTNEKRRVTNITFVLKSYT